jgi:hypothetical protein
MDYIIRLSRIGKCYEEVITYQVSNVEGERDAFDKLSRIQPRIIGEHTNYDVSIENIEDKEIAENIRLLSWEYRDKSS